MYDIEKLLTVLKNPAYRVVDKDGNVFPPSNQIYASIETVMNGNPKGKHVYTIVKNNRNGIYDNLLHAFSITLPTNETTIDESFNPNTSTTNTPIYKFKIIISTTEWLSIKPEETVYNDGKKYVILKPGWTDLFAAKIWEKSRFSCVWSFKYAKGSIRKKEKNASIKLKGQCKECGARIIGLIENYSVKNKDILSEITIKDYKPDFIHKTRRQLAGKRRLDIAGNLIDTKTDAITYIRNEAKTLMEFGDPYPPILPNTDVLRKAKSEMQEKRLGITGSLPISNLVDAENMTHIGIIKKVGASPFFCHYWTKEQKLLYKLNSKFDKSSFMTIDATGSIVKKIRYTHVKSKHIFLYQCMSVSSAGSVPVFQMLSADHTATAITTWLLTILSDNVAIPQMIVCDFSMALLISIAIAFGKKADLKDYMNTCYDIIINQKETLPATYIRIDVSHLVAIICRWICVKKHPFAKVRQFFIRSICQAYQMQSIENLEYFLESILVVVLSHTLTCNSSQLPSQIRFEYVNSIIKGMPIEINKEIEHAETSENEKIEEDKYKKYFKQQSSQPWVKWSTKIYDQASNIASQCFDGETLNAYYNIEVAENLKRLMYYLPLWTGIMIPFFGIGNRVATSSSVEAEFANIKIRAFKNELPLRADKFIFRHVDYLDGRVKEASAKSTFSKPESLKKKVKAILKEPTNENVDVITEINDTLMNTNVSQSNYSVDLSSSKVEVFDILQDSSRENVENILQANIKINNAMDNKNLKKETNEFDYNDVNDVQDVNIENVNDTLEANIKIKKAIDKSLEEVNESNFSDIQDVGMEKVNNVLEESLERNKAINDKSSEDVNESDLEQKNPLKEHENWRGKITPGKKRKHSTYMDPFPDWDFVQSHKFVDIPILRNGNMCESIKFKNKYVCVKNTCAFDSLVQILAHAIGKEKFYKNYIQDFEYPVLKLAQHILARGKIIANDYKIRMEILQKTNICKISGTRYVQFLDATCNVDCLTQKLFMDIPSVIRYTNCSNCKYVQHRNLPTLCTNIEILFRKGFDYIQEAIDDTENLNVTQACKKCCANLERQHDYGPHIFLDTSVISDSSYNVKCKKTVSLENFTKIIKLGEKSYSLCGIIEYKGNQSKSFEMGHYTAIVYTGFSWYEYDSLRTKKMYVSSEKIVTPHTIMYVRNK